MPEDVAIVGFDNWNVMTEATRPPLTSVDMNLGALGSEAGAALLEMIAGHRSPACAVRPARWSFALCAEGGPAAAPERNP